MNAVSGKIGRYLFGCLLEDDLRCFRFGEDILIESFGLVVGLFGGGAFGGGDLADFGIPAGIDGFDTPLSTALAGTDGLIGDFDENGVGVGAGEDAGGDPTGLRYVYIEIEGFG